MINRDLTPDEVESLLHTPSEDVVKEGNRAPVVLTLKSSTKPPSEVRQRLDESLSNRLSDAMVRVGQHWCQALAQPMRTTVATKVASVKLMNHAEVLRQFESPACVEILDSDVMDGYVFLQIDRSLVFSMIDRLLGGGRQPASVVRRPLTEIETSLLQRLTEPWRDELNRNFDGKHLGALRSIAVESQLDRLPQNPDGQVVLTEMSLELGEVKGTFRVGTSVEAATQLQSTDAGETLVSKSLRPNGLAVIAGNVRIRADEAHTLSVGQTVFAQSALPRVYVDRKLLYSGKLGASGGKKAVQVDGYMEKGST